MKFREVSKIDFIIRQNYYLILYSPGELMSICYSVKKIDIVFFCISANIYLTVYGKKFL